MFPEDSSFERTGLFHIYSTGMTGMFNYGDCGTTIDIRSKMAS